MENKCTIFFDLAFFDMFVQESGGGEIDESITFREFSLIDDIRQYLVSIGYTVRDIFTTVPERGLVDIEHCGYSEAFSFTFESPVVER